ncbi:MAG: L,D-transpeptidase family protein [Rhodobacteraceae bacterium]|nr:L,D-transpeptidase family protein [Paracoccaceae bacterium]
MSARFNAKFFRTTAFAAFASIAPLSAHAQATALTLPPESGALMTALSAGSDPSLYAYYEGTDFEPVFAGRPAKLAALMAALEGAGAHGLPVNDTLISDLRVAMINAGTPDSKAALEMMAAQAYIDFATDLTSGLLNPDDISSLININAVRPATDTLLAKAVASNGSGALFDGLEPQDPSYNALQEELARLEALVEAGGWGPKISVGRAIRPGQSNDRVLAMRVRLTALGYADIEGDSPRYDEALVEAVKAFQAENTLTADGIVGPQTLTALNSDPSIQMQQVIVNLERRRWLNYDLGARHIFVNQANFTAYVIDYGLPTLVTRVVVGKASAKFQTPEFIDEMTHMVVNPAWNVPQSIASQEYLPQLLRDPSVLTRQNITMRVRGSGERVDARLIDMSQYTVNNFPFVLQQRPGSRNALGRVKFMFPNKYNIYLHDTPSRSLFNRDSRAFSHGCVRVHRPLDLAYTLLAPQSNDPEGDFQAARNTGRETTISLETPVPIYLTYQSVFLNEAGELAYRVDVYGRDQLVFDALAENGVALPEIAS